MRTFRVALTGDFLGETGTSAYGDIGLSLLESVPFVAYRFLPEHAPDPADRGYFDRLYSLEVTPDQIADTDGLIVLRPWIKATTFARGAENLAVIGRSGAGYDKIDVEACTANDVALFNAPEALTHSTASSALTFMLALAKCLPQQDRVVRQGRWDLQARVMGVERPGVRSASSGWGAPGASWCGSSRRSTYACSPTRRTPIRLPRPSCRWLW